MVGCAPVPNARPGSITRSRVPGRGSLQGGLYAYARNPKAREKARASALTVAPQMVRGLKGGVRHPVDVEAWIMMQEVSGLFSAEEAAALRQEAGL